MSDQPKFEIVAQAPLNVVQLNQIASSLSKIIDRHWLDDAMQDIAGSYLRWIKQPEAPKGEVRSHLAMIAHLTYNMELPGADLVALAEEIRLVVGSLHPTARAYMWWGIDQLIKPNSESLESTLFRCDDFKLIGNAATLAIGILPKAGSYTDGSLGLAIQLLVQAYEIATGRTATFSRIPFGAPSKNGTYSTKAGSECGRFVLAFFACVHTERGVTLPTSSLEKFLSARRQQAI